MEEKEIDPADLADAVVAFVSRPNYQPVKPRVIAKKLGLPKERISEVRKAVKRLYALLHIPPGERAQQILFDESPPEDSRLSRAAAMSLVLRSSVGSQGHQTTRCEESGASRRRRSVSQAEGDGTGPGCR